MTTRSTANSSSVWLRVPREQLPKVLARFQRFGYPWRRFGFAQFEAVVELAANISPSLVHTDQFAFTTTAPDGVHWIERPRYFHLAGPREPLANLAPCTAVIRIPLRLGKTPRTSWDESFWVLDVGADHFLSILRNLDERVLRRFEFAHVGHAKGERLVLRAGPSGPKPVLPPPFRGFVEHKSRHGIFVPAGTAFVPPARPDRLGEALVLAPLSLIWIEDTTAGFDRHRIPVSAFRPLDEIVSYTAPEVERMADVRGSTPTFPLVPFTQRPEPQHRPQPSHPPIERPEGVTKLAPSGWLGRILAASRRAGKRPTRVTPTPSVTGAPRMPSSSTPPAISRNGQKLLDGILNRHPSTPQAEVAQMWVELAHTLTSPHHSADAAVCWINAIWERPSPPTEWLVAWLRAEERSAPGPDGTPRFATAVLTKLGSATDAPTHTEHVRQLLELIEAHEPDLPVRTIWLAHMAAARTTGGDTLGLARCRDRLLGRLATTGLALGIDAPSFLRSHTSVDAEGVRATHRWLTAVREPIHRWIRKQATGSGLGWVGLDTNIGSSTAYVDLILAWGLSRLGDRVAADRLVHDAKATLHDLKGKKGERRVHHTLLGRFQDRIRAAQGGVSESHEKWRPPAPELVLTPLGRYAVDALSSKLTIFSTVGTPHPRRGMDLHPLFGSDPLGTRLAELVRTQDATIVTEYLSAAALDPTARTLPRVTLALAELCGRIDSDTATVVLKLLPRAIELLPEAVRLNGITGGGAHNLLIRFVARAIETGCSLANRYHLPADFETLVSCLNDHLTQGDSVVQAAMTQQLARAVATLRKLGKSAVIDRLIVASAQDRTALGCYLRGQTNAAIQHLNVLRDDLYGSGRSTDRQRTRSAFALVAALAHAPADLALDRLSEMFDRLDRIHTAGATARYFALRPLELVDAAVSAVVSERFDLSPVVRRWLDEDEFRVRQRIARDLTAALDGA